MSALDGYGVFSSGPCEFVVSPWSRKLVRRDLPGLDGEVVFDFGARARTITQTGRLRTGSPAAMRTVVESINGFQDGQTHLLADNHGNIYRDVIIQRFEPRTPVLVGRAVWADYTIEYLQLP